MWTVYPNLGKILAKFQIKSIFGPFRVRVIWMNDGGCEKIPMQK